jgi:hypothetical protein
MNKVNSGKTRILVGPTEIAGYYSNLVFGLQACGCKAIYGVISHTKFEYGLAHPESSARKICLYCSFLAQKFQKILLLNIVTRILFRFSGSVYLLWQLPRIDVVIFGFGYSYLPFNLDLPLLRFCGKIVIGNLGHGSEMRPPYLDGSYLPSDPSKPIPAHIFSRKTRKMCSRIRWFERWSNFLIGAPLSSSYFASKPYINWFAIGVPFDSSSLPSFSEYSHSFEEASSKVFRIIHAPSNPVLKGTFAIRDIIKNLSDRGFLIDYRELQNIPNSEVLLELQSCDLVVDQMFSDTPMAGLVVEAAFFGKPSLVGGYGLEYLMEKLPNTWRPPSIICRPEQFEVTLQNVLQKSEILKQMGSQARDFVVNHWSSSIVAQRYLRLINSDVPSNWWCDPFQISYLHGCGMSEAQLLQSLSSIIRSLGPKGLELKNRPDLQQSILDLLQTSLPTNNNVAEFI